jgi:multifunctional methyltransferase subunit TRM112
LPENAPESDEVVTEDLLKKLHHVLMEVRVSVDQGGGDLRLTVFLPCRQIHVEEGSMNCRGCGHVYQISSGIPNMVCTFFAGTNVLTVI